MSKQGKHTNKKHPKTMNEVSKGFEDFMKKHPKKKKTVHKTTFDKAITKVVISKPVSK